jgi:hypothetical protein
LLTCGCWSVHGVSGVSRPTCRVGKKEREKGEEKEVIFEQNEFGDEREDKLCVLGLGVDYSWMYPYCTSNHYITDLLDDACLIRYSFPHTRFGTC